MAVRILRLDNGGLQIYDESPDSDDSITLNKTEVMLLKDKLTVYLTKGEIRN